MEKIVRRFIEPAPGFAGELGIWVASLDDVRRRTLEAVAGLTPEQLAWKPPGGGNSIGQLLRHIALVELDWVFTDLCRHEPLPKTAPPILLLDGPMADPGPQPLEIFAAALDYARKETKTRLGRYGRDEIETSREDVGNGGRRVFNVRWILLHILNHEAQHTGQILSVKRMMKNKEENKE
jgi:uncharacterized damage-inducible protein DinB